MHILIHIFFPESHFQQLPHTTGYKDPIKKFLSYTVQ